MNPSLGRLTTEAQGFESPSHVSVLAHHINVVLALAAARPSRSCFAPDLNRHEVRGRRLVALAEGVGEEAVSLAQAGGALSVPPRRPLASLPMPSRMATKCPKSPSARTLGKDRGAWSTHRRAPQVSAAYCRDSDHASLAPSPKSVRTCSSR
jgi:hypothetical protein